jgi:hypothetical protein
MRKRSSRRRAEVERALRMALEDLDERVILFVDDELENNLLGRRRS